MLILTTSEVIELKKQASEQFNINIHFHDCCGGQHFSVDSPTPQIHDFIVKFFNEKGISVEFSDDLTQFYVKEGA